MADYTAMSAKAERGLALPQSLPYCGYTLHQLAFKLPGWWQPEGETLAAGSAARGVNCLH